MTSSCIRRRLPSRHLFPLWDRFQRTCGTRRQTRQSEARCRPRGPDRIGRLGPSRRANDNRQRGRADSDVRYCVLASLDEKFDGHLAQAENLSALFISLNDEVFEIRELTLCIIGRLSSLNPAYIMPPLRKVLIQVRLGHFILWNYGPV